MLDEKSFIVLKGKFRFTTGLDLIIFDENTFIFKNNSNIKFKFVKTNNQWLYKLYLWIGYPPFCLLYSRNELIVSTCGII